MPEPLTIAAAIVGMAMAADRISSLLGGFTKRVIAAHQQAEIILSEVNDFRQILSQLEPIFRGKETPDRSRASLLRVEEMIIIISNSVLTFSELDQLLDSFRTENFDILDRLRWVRREAAIMDLTQRLQHHKGLLSLVPDILHGFVSVYQILSSCWR